MARYFLTFLIIVLVGLFQTTIWSFNFLLLVILILSLSLSAEESLTFAFLGGFILDLFSGGRLGFSSLGFVLITFLLQAYNRRFSFQNPFLVFAFSLLAYFLFSWLTQRSVIWWEGLALAILVLALRSLAPFLFKPSNQEQLKIEL